MRDEESRHDESGADVVPATGSTVSLATTPPSSIARTTEGRADLPSLVLSLSTALELVLEALETAADALGERLGIHSPARRRPADRPPTG